MSTPETTLTRTITAIRGDVLEAGRRAELAVAHAVEAFVRSDEAWAESVITSANQATLRSEVERRCISVITAYRPAVRQLQQVLAAMFAAGEVARVAELAAAIARLTPTDAGDEHIDELRSLAAAALDLLDGALEAYAATDRDAAFVVLGSRPATRASEALVMRSLAEGRVIAARQAAHYLAEVAAASTRIAGRVLIEAPLPEEVTAQAA